MSMPHPLEGSQQHRRAVLRVLLLMTVAGGLVFGFLNLGRGLYLLAGAELVYALVAALLYPVAAKTPHLRGWTLAFLLPFFSLMILALLLPTTSRSVFAWILTIPIICYLLLGLRTGLWMSGAFVALGVAGYSTRHLDGSLLDNLVVLVNVTFSALAMILFSHVYERSRVRNEQRLIDLASTDSLTGLANRLKLAEVFARERAHAVRDGKALSLMLFDLDHFKRVNDRYGHEAGDQALRHVAWLLESRLRATDLFCRLGGEEMAILLPGAGLAQAAATADELRELLAKTPLELDGGDSVVLTFSAGVATLGRDGEGLDGLLSTADRRLYEAKGGGRNRVVAASD